jgi:hypothetical protein
MTSLEVMVLGSGIVGVLIAFIGLFIENLTIFSVGSILILIFVIIMKIANE